jgi:hypothetical protein
MPVKELAATLRPFANIAQLAAYALVLARIFSAGLHKTYRSFTIYICFEAIRLATVGFIPVATNLYSYAYFVTQPFAWCLYLLVILELCQLALRNHAGIATFARRGLIGALGISTAVSLGTLAFDGEVPGLDDIVRSYFLVERLILSSLLIFLLLFTAFLAYFPVPVNRNTVMHTRIFACYFFVRTVILIFRNLISGDAVYGINIFVSLLATATLTAWAMLLSRAGEEVKTTTSYRRDPEAERRLIAQLDALNDTLLSSVKK